VVAIDLPGHGESGGWARLGADEHVDVIAALEQAKAEWVVLFGWSLGAGVCLRAAAELAGRGVVAGVICEAPYLDPLTPARNVMRARGLPVRGVVGVAQRINGMMLGVGGVFGGAWRGFDRVGSARRLAEAGVPMLVVCGDADGVCPVEHAREIAAAAGASGSLIEVVGGGHTDLWSVPQHRARASGGVREFVSRVGGTGQGGRPN
jgi:pimeloyl-ACP methyl ester carboxylesterase